MKGNIEMSEQPNYVEGRGNLITMAKPCKDCNKEWSMYESEIAFYEKLVKEKGYTMPIRCASCRKKHSQAKMKDPISLSEITDLVFKMAKSADEGAYTFHDTVLCKELRELGDKLNLYMKQNRIKRHDTTESVS